jgi:hypothetical protein
VVLPAHLRFRDDRFFDGYQRDEVGTKAAILLMNGGTQSSPHRTRQMTGGLR